MTLVYQQVFSRNQQRQIHCQPSSQLQGLTKLGFQKPLNLQKLPYIQKFQKQFSSVIVQQQGYDNTEQSQLQPEDVVPGGIYDGTVERQERYGLFVNIGVQRPGLVHISEVGPGFTSAEDMYEQYPVGASVQVLLVSQDRNKGTMTLSIKRCDPNYQDRPSRGPPRESSDDGYGYQNRSRSSYGNDDRGSRGYSEYRPPSNDDSYRSRDSYQPRRRQGERRDVTMSIEDLQTGQELQGRIVGQIEPGYFVSVGCEKDGMLYNRFVEQELQVGDSVTCFVQSVNLQKQQIRLVMNQDQIESTQQGGGYMRSQEDSQF